MGSPCTTVDSQHKNEISQISDCEFEEKQEEISVCENSNETIPAELLTVSLDNSSRVQIGDIYYHGPVIVKQIEVPSKQDSTLPNNFSKESPKSKKIGIRRLNCLSPPTRSFIFLSLISVVLPLSIYYTSKIWIKKELDDTIAKGTKIFDRGTWNARSPATELMHLQTPVPVVMISNSQTSNCDTFDQCSEMVRGFQNYHMDMQRKEDIAFNFLIGGDGGIYVGRGWDKVGDHTLGYNHRSLGICLIGNFEEEEPTLQQISATHALIHGALGRRKLSSDYRLLGQNQVKSTPSPGTRLIALIENWPHFDASVHFPN